MLEEKTASAGRKIKEQNGAETAWRHPHPTQSPEATPTPQSQQLPLPTANSSRKQCWSPSHRATSQPLAPGAQLGPRSPARLTQAVVCGSAPRHKFPQTTLTCPRADPTPCTRQSPMRLLNKALGTPRQSKHEAQPGTGTGWTLGHSVSPARGERAPKSAVAAPELPSLSMAEKSYFPVLQGSTKQLCLTQENREGEALRQNQGTHGAEKRSEQLQSTTERCV